MKTFIGISSLIFQSKLVYLTTSTGECLFNIDGVSSLQVIDFLYALHHKRDHQNNIVFVCYAFSRDNEFAFSLLTPELKDKLFQSRNVTEKIKKLESEQIENKIKSDKTLDVSTIEYLDFERYVNELSIKELQTITYQGYKLQLVNSKFLTIGKPKQKSITIYDVFGFFRTSIEKASKLWLQKEIKVLAGKRKAKSLEVLKTLTDCEAQVISELTAKLNTELITNGITLSKFHGASAISSKILANSKAKKEFHSYKFPHQTSFECWKASQQAYYGGRVEQLKIGTLENIHVYDINSAYAYAALFLPKFLRKPIFSKTYNAQPFSWWYCEYDFRNLDLYFGLLPTRLKGKINTLTYNLQGKGYYYQPEIELILKHFPNSIKILQGFYVPFKRPAFADYILTIYEIRRQLKAQNNPLEKVFKLALAGIYGKFCQHKGRGYYYNFYYAGFITSKIRALLLQTTLRQQKEKRTICFLTDAIHNSTTINTIALSDNIGDFRLTQYENGTYYGLGIYDLVDREGKHKQAHQGYNSFNFQEALQELKDNKYYTGEVQTFTGWNNFIQKVFHSQYLSDTSQDKKNKPFETMARTFDLSDIDLSQSYIDSQITKNYSNMESGLYRESNYNSANFALDTITAGRI